MIFCPFQIQVAQVHFSIWNIIRTSISYFETISRLVFVLSANGRCLGQFQSTGRAGTIFSIERKRTTNLMDLFIIILSFLLAYGLFVVIAIKLAKVLFPKISDEEMELKSRAMQQRQPKRAGI
jgi:uncharacterized protein YqhQ